MNGYGTGIDDQQVELEAMLEIDMLAGINPALTNIIVPGGRTVSPACIFRWPKK